MFTRRRSISASSQTVPYAWQRGLIPLSLAAIEAAIELNGVAVSLNKSAFDWGRRAALDMPAVLQAVAPEGQAPSHHRLSETVDEIIARRVTFLTAYQDVAYAARYAAVVHRVQAVEETAAPGAHLLTTAVARTLFQLMAYKDEYEVARLQTDTRFIERLRAQFDGPLKLTFHMAPPLISKRDPVSGEPRKIRVGAWIVPVFKVLARLRGLRGTPLDLFGYTEERRLERRLIGDYISLVERQILPFLSPASHRLAVALADAPRGVKGYGHVKAHNAATVEAAMVKLLADFQSDAH